MEEEAQIATTEMIIFKTPKHDMYKARKVPKKIHPIPEQQETEIRIRSMDDRHRPLRPLLRSSRWMDSTLKFEGAPAPCLLTSHF